MRGALLLVCLLGAAVPAGADGPRVVPLPEALREAARAQAGRLDLERQRCRYVVAVNMSANLENGIVGQQIRGALRQLVDGFFDDGERISILPFQLEVERGEELVFKAQDRRAIRDTLDRLCSSAGRPGGGSDVELAKHKVLLALRSEAATGVGIVLTNHDKSQQPRIRPPGWRGLSVDLGRDREGTRLAEEMGVVWQKAVVASQQRGRDVFSTYAHIAVRPGTDDPKSPPRSPPPVISPVAFAICVGALVLVGLVVAGLGLPSIPVIVGEDKSRELTFSQRSFGIAVADGARNERDVELGVPIGRDVDPILAEVDRGMLGGVRIRSGESTLVEGESRRPMPHLPLRPGVQTVKLVKKQGREPLATLRIQVGRSARPARAGKKDARTKTGGSPPPRRR